MPRSARTSLNQILLQIAHRHIRQHNDRHDVDTRIRVLIDGDFPVSDTDQLHHIWMIEILHPQSFHEKILQLLCTERAPQRLQGNMGRPVERPAKNLPKIPASDVLTDANTIGINENGSNLIDKILILKLEWKATRDCRSASVLVADRRAHRVCVFVREDVGRSGHERVDELDDDWNVSGEVDVAPSDVDKDGERDEKEKKGGNGRDGGEEADTDGVGVDDEIRCDEREKENRE